MKILMAAAEAVPFAKTGGLGDVAGVLPRFLAERGHDVRVVMPLYRHIDREKYELRPIGGPLGVPMGIIGELWGAIWEGRVPGSDVPVYFVEFEQYFGRTGIYTEPGGAGYTDNDNRYVFLSRAALQVCKALHFEPDVVHCNDWHTAAIPLFLNTVYAGDPLGRAASVLTIHNMQHQGNFYPGLMDVLGVGWEHFNHLELECDDQVNLLKGGLYHATMLTTVSRRYAVEISTPDFGFGLDGVMRDRMRDLRGIINGIDYTEWSPTSDPLIAAPYSADDLSGKAVCKRRLQEEMHLPTKRVPLIGMVTRLVDQKGIDIVAAALERILELDVQVVLLGTGEAWAHAHFAGVAARHPDKFACRLAYDNGLAHRIEAGSDFFLMPSRFEPCGLNQLYSLSYGTLPIVHAVGGLDDTVDNYVEATGEGTGFKLYDLNPRALFDTVGWAVHTWYNRPDAIRIMQRRAMNQRFAWQGSAEAYEQVYAEAVARRPR